MPPRRIFPLLLAPGLLALLAWLGLPACASAPGAPASAPPPAASAPAVAPAASLHPQPASDRPALRRGINLGNALDAPTEGEWGVVLGASDFVSARQAGFDHVRLPVRFSAHAMAGPPYTIDRDFFARVDWAVGQALSNGLSVIVDFHYDPELVKAPDEHRAQFLAIWRQIAERYADRPASVAFEILNEPNGELTADKWNDILAEALKIVRASNPTRSVVVEGVFWASANSLTHTLKIPTDDPNLVGSFHMYQPMLLTHQGASWMTQEYETRGVVFPGPPPQPLSPGAGAGRVEWVRKWFERYNQLPTAQNPSGPTTITEELDIAQVFAERTHLPVYMGEFGCIENADPKSREAWVRTTRKEAELRGFGWAYWDDGGTFKIYNRADRTWVTALKSALLD